MCSGDLSSKQDMNFFSPVIETDFAGSDKMYFQKQLNVLRSNPTFTFELK